MLFCSANARKKPLRCWRYVVELPRELVLRRIGWRLLRELKLQRKRQGLLRVTCVVATAFDPARVYVVVDAEEAAAAWAAIVLMDNRVRQCLDARIDRVTQILSGAAVRYLAVQGQICQCSLMDVLRPREGGWPRPPEDVFLSICRQAHEAGRVGSVIYKRTPAVPLLLAIQRAFEVNHVAAGELWIAKHLVWGFLGGQLLLSGACMIHIERLLQNTVTET